jgi:hypothetical protein
MLYPSHEKLFPVFIRQHAKGKHLIPVVENKERQKRETLILILYLIDLQLLTKVNHNF